MRVENYGPALHGLLKDFAEILHERDRLTVQLAERLAAIRAICRVPGEKGPKPPDISTMEERIWQPRPSLSYAIESLLRNSAHSWTPVQVRDALLERGYDLRKYSFAMAAVHTTLKALVARGAVYREVLADESKLHWWRQTETDTDAMPQQ